MTKQCGNAKIRQEKPVLAAVTGPVSGDSSCGRDAFIKALSEYFSVIGPLERCGDLLCRLFNSRPKVIIISRTADDMDAMAFMRRLRQTVPFRSTCFILLCDEITESIRSVCKSFSIDGVVSVGGSPESAAKEIFGIYDEFDRKVKENAVDSIKELVDDPLYFTDRSFDDYLFESITDSLLLPLGFNVDHAGTKYLQLLVSMRVVGIEFTLSEGYRDIAESYRTTPAAVEKAIRYSIESAWSKGSVFMQQKLFGNSVDAFKGKPTNAEFVETVVRHELDKLRSSVSKSSLS